MEVSFAELMPSGAEPQRRSGVRPVPPAQGHPIGPSHLLESTAGCEERSFADMLPSGGAQQKRSGVRLVGGNRSHIDGAGCSVPGAPPVGTGRRPPPGAAAELVGPNATAALHHQGRAPLWAHGSCNPQYLDRVTGRTLHPGQYVDSGVRKYQATVEGVPLRAKCDTIGLPSGLPGDRRPHTDADGVRTKPRLSRFVERPHRDPPPPKHFGRRRVQPRHLLEGGTGVLP
eukprot:TRINITY_DN60422_c0_g1_i1.p2 TRINITY_DN60422_c0_g1~~TRINITY_DN60422_c0_g1_i1.p2  ORF type:complete len:256 (+),score=41.78 TRINITY_DN60422_c0_g1_i1:83-769(+)